MAYCAKCGYPATGARFCAGCGQRSMAVVNQQSVSASTVETPWQTVWKPIITTLVLLMLFAIITAVTMASDPIEKQWIMIGCLIAASIIWAVIDAILYRLFDYKTTLASNAFVLCLVLCGFWIIFFPWYLSVRGRIKRGTIQRRNSASPANTLGLERPPLKATSVWAQVGLFGFLLLSGVLGSWWYGQQRTQASDD